MFVLLLYNRVSLNKFDSPSPRGKHAGSRIELFRSILNTLVQELIKSTLLEYSVEVHTVEIPQKEGKQAYKFLSSLTFRSPNFSSTRLAAL